MGKLYRNADGKICLNADGKAIDLDSFGICCDNFTGAIPPRCFQITADSIDKGSGSYFFFASAGSLDLVFSTFPGSASCTFGISVLDPDAALIYRQDPGTFKEAWLFEQIIALNFTYSAGTYTASALWEVGFGIGARLFYGEITSATPIDISSPLVFTNTLTVNDPGTGAQIDAGENGTLTFTPVACPCVCSCDAIGPYTFTLGLSGGFDPILIDFNLTTCGARSGVAFAGNGTYDLQILAQIYVTKIADVCTRVTIIAVRWHDKTGPVWYCFYRFVQDFADDPTDAGSWVADGVISTAGDVCGTLTIDDTNTGSTACNFDASECPEFFRGVARLSNGGTHYKSFCLERQIFLGDGGGGAGAEWSHTGVDYSAVLFCAVIDGVALWILDITQSGGRYARFTQPISGCPTNNWTFDSGNTYTGGSILIFEETDECAAGACADCTDTYFVNLANSDGGYYDGVYSGAGMGFVGGPPPYTCYWDGESINLGPSGMEIVRTEGWRDEDDPNICYVKLTITSSPDGSRVGKYFLVVTIDSGNCLPLPGWTLIENTIDTSTTISVFLSL